jgi:tetratricopeptide (TPR) repeat protein
VSIDIHGPPRIWKTHQPTRWWLVPRTHEEEPDEPAVPPPLARAAGMDSGSSSGDEYADAHDEDSEVHRDARRPSAAARDAAPFELLAANGDALNALAAAVAALAAAVPLQHAAAERKGDREVVLAAVGQDGQALRYASAELKGDGDYPKTIECQTSALAISREIGDRRGEDNSLGNLGSTHLQLGDYPKAIECQTAALAISREIGDRRGECNRLGNLGSAHESLGDYPKAIECQTSALAISREIGDRRGEREFMLAAVGRNGRADGDMFSVAATCPPLGAKLGEVAATLEPGLRRVGAVPAGG